MIAIKAEISPGTNIESAFGIGVRNYYEMIKSKSRLKLALNY